MADITGTNNDDTLYGTSDSDFLNGMFGDDVLKGGGGADKLFGLGGNDTIVYSDSWEGVSVNLSTNRLFGGTAEGDNLRSIENVYGSGFNDSLIGYNYTDNELYGLAGNDVLDGRDGNDRLDGGVGHDALKGGGGDDTLQGGEDDDNLTGGDGADVLFGGAGNDTANYADALASVTILLYNNQAWGDAQGDYFNSIENLTGSFHYDVLVGDGGANGIRGLAGNDSLEGRDGDDLLDGGSGDDTMQGGAGNDVYYVDSVWDLVLEGAGLGTDDQVFASARYVLRSGQEIETLSTTDRFGTAGIDLIGNEIANKIHGNAGINVLDGRGGADTMVGFGGSDMFLVDNAADVVVDGLGEGAFDGVVASTSYTLAAGAEIEWLSTNHFGTNAINLTGNEFANRISGNAGANRLDGKGGADLMGGLGGDDFFFVDDAGDLVLDGAGEGAGDRVFASTSYTLTDDAEIERFSTTDHAGTGAVNLTGNELANTIYGNAGANRLDGRAGSDTLVGLGGNDFFFVDAAADAVIDRAGEGTGDRVFASASYTLTAGAEIEKFSTTDHAGTNSIDLTGNELANTIFGNAGSNALKGMQGNDTLVGLGGSDRFVFDASFDPVNNIDVVVDFSAADDGIILDRGIFTALPAGTLAAANLRMGAAAADADDRIIYHSASGSLSYDPDGTGAAAQIQFATLIGAPTLAAEAFHIV